MKTRFHPVPMESFKSKQNLNPVQDRFDRAITQLFPGGRIHGLPVVAIVPVPLTFRAPASLSNFTDASIAAEDGRDDREWGTVYPIAGNLAWLTVTPIPTGYWNAKKLKNQEARWHAELRRMWFDGTYAYAGRRAGDDSHSWDVSKNPLQDPYDIRVTVLPSGKQFLAPRYGIFDTLVVSQDFALLRVSGEPVVQISSADLERLEMPCHGDMVSLSSPLVTNLSDRDMVLGVLQYRGNQPQTRRSMRDHLSASRQALVVDAVSDIFEHLRQYPQNTTSTWPRLVRRHYDTVQVLNEMLHFQEWVDRPSPELLNWLDVFIRAFRVSSGRVRFHAFADGILRKLCDPHSGGGSKLVIERPPDIAGGLRLVEIPLPPYTVCDVRVDECLTSGQEFASVDCRCFADALTDRSSRLSWMNAVLALIHRQLRLSPCLPVGVVPGTVDLDLCSVAVPTGFGKIGRDHRGNLTGLPPLIYEWPIWNRFETEKNGIVWNFRPSDARFVG